MTWAIDALAKGPNEESAAVTFSGIPERPLAPQKEAVRESMFDTFPTFFGCDPVHVEVHVREEEE